MRTTTMMKVEPHERLRYFVTSNSDPQDRYLVDLLSGECGCIDYGVRHREEGTDCKHLRAAKRYFANEILSEIRRLTKKYEGP